MSQSDQRPKRPRAFVIFGTMRTGSNFLEASLSEYPSIDMRGELFNPAFIGEQKAPTVQGISVAARDADPVGFLHGVIDRAQGLLGFRFFDGHDLQVYRHLLADPAIAKVVLVRDRLQSFLSLKRAQATGQWRLGDFRDQKAARITFDLAEFQAYRAEVDAFYEALRRDLLTSGQAAMTITYDDLSSPEMLNGLVRFLGIDAVRDKVSSKTKIQFSEAIEDLVTNPEALAPFLAGAPALGTGRDEAARGAGLPLYRASPTAPLLYLPIRGGTALDVESWLAPKGTQALRFDSRAALQDWKRAHPDFRSFAIVRHPEWRMLDLFLRGFDDKRAETLKNRYKLRLAEDCTTQEDRQAALAAFAQVVRAALNGQTSFAAPPEWASQSALAQGLAQIALPDHVLREEDCASRLPGLAKGLGALAKPKPLPEGWFSAEVSRAVREAWGRDYVNFGYSHLPSD